MEILKGKTTSGFEYEIPEKRLKNFELVEAIGVEIKEIFESQKDLKN